MVLGMLELLIFKQFACEQRYDIRTSRHLSLSVVVLVIFYFECCSSWHMILEAPLEGSPLYLLLCKLMEDLEPLVLLDQRRSEASRLSWSACVCH